MSHKDLFAPLALRYHVHMHTYTYTYVRTNEAAIYRNIHTFVCTHIYRVRGVWGGGRGSSRDGIKGRGSGAEVGTEADVGGESFALVPVCVHACTLNESRQLTPELKSGRRVFCFGPGARMRESVPQPRLVQLRV